MISRKEIESAADAQHTEICKLVDRQALQFRQSMSGVMDSHTALCRLDAYLVGFLGEQGSVFHDRINFTVRNYRIALVDGRQYLIPERTSEEFLNAVKKQFPNAAASLGDYVTFG